MATVTINGHTYTDDSDPTTGLAGGGHRTRFVPALADVVVVAGQVQSTSAGNIATATASATAAASASSSAAAASAASAAASASYINGVAGGGTAAALHGSSSQAFSTAGLTVNGTATMNVGGYGAGLNLTGSSTIGTDIKVANTDTGGNIWHMLSRGSASGQAGQFQFHNETDNATVMTLDANGNSGLVFINSTVNHANENLQVTGSGYFSGAVATGALSVTGKSVSTTNTSFSAIDTGWSVGAHNTAGFGIRLGASANRGVVQVSENSTAYGLSLQPYGGRVMVGANFTDDGVNALQVNGGLSVTGAISASTKVLAGGVTDNGLASIQSNNGISLKASGAGSTALTHYETGTWTPTVYGGTTAGTTGYSTQGGSFTRVGNVVTCTVACHIYSPTGTGNIMIGGLPYAMGGYTTAKLNMFGFAASQGGELYLSNASGSEFYIIINDGGVSVGLAQMSQLNDFQFYGTFTYLC